MTPEEIKAYFDDNPPPFEVEGKPWAKIINSKKFLEACFNGIQQYKGNYANCPDYWHLMEFYQDVIGNKADNL